ncbi:MAG: hypothetical protein ACT4OE_04135 [Sphingosinicella sp.]
MIDSLVTLAVLVAMFLVALPAIAAISLGRSGLAAVPFYLVLVAGLFTYHFGLSLGARLPPASLAGQAPAGLCAQLLTRSEQAGLILGRRDADPVRVDRTLWVQLPDQGQEAIGLCLDLARPSDRRDNPVNIVEALPR